MDSRKALTLALQGKRRSAALSLFFAVLAALASPVGATSTAPTPGDSILLIYNSGDVYDTSIKDNIKAALLTVGAPLSLIHI